MSDHPEHTMQQVAEGVEYVDFPPHPKGWWLGFTIRRACRKRGGHWWHPSDEMIENRCCQCGASRDGSPKDGT